MSTVRAIRETHLEAHKQLRQKTQDELKRLQDEPKFQRWCKEISGGMVLPQSVIDMQGDLLERAEMHYTCAMGRLEKREAQGWPPELLESMGRMYADTYRGILEHGLRHIKLECSI